MSIEPLHRIGAVKGSCSSLDSESVFRMRPSGFKRYEEIISSKGHDPASCTQELRDSNVGIYCLDLEELDSGYWHSGFSISESKLNGLLYAG
jgi:hypothetical protein